MFHCPQSAVCHWRESSSSTAILTHVELASRYIWPPEGSAQCYSDSYFQYADHDQSTEILLGSLQSGKSLLPLSLEVLTFVQAVENICHGNTSSSIETFYDLLFQPDLNPMLRASVNSCIAMHADIGRHPDKMNWIIEARQILHELKDWATDSKSKEQLNFWRSALTAQRG